MDKLYLGCEELFQGVVSHFKNPVLKLGVYLERQKVHEILIDESCLNPLQWGKCSLQCYSGLILKMKTYSNDIPTAIYL